MTNFPKNTPKKAVFSSKTENCNFFKKILDYRVDFLYNNKLLMMMGDYAP